MKDGNSLTAAGKSLVQWIQPKRIARRQQSCIAIAVAIWADLWAADRPASIGSTLAYTLPLCNLTVLVEDHLGFLYNRKRPPLGLSISGWCSSSR